jgi:hypothetical protein
MFSRTIGGTVAVALFGALFNARVAAAAPGLPLEATMRPLEASLSQGDMQRLTSAVEHGLRGVLVVLACVCFASLVVAWGFPRGVVARTPVVPEPV